MMFVGLQYSDGEIGGADTNSDWVMNIEVPGGSYSEVDYMRHDQGVDEGEVSSPSDFRVVCNASWCVDRSSPCVGPGPCVGVVGRAEKVLEKRQVFGVAVEVAHYDAWWVSLCFVFQEDGFEESIGLCGLEAFGGSSSVAISTIADHGCLAG